jgi:hypothetical protein
MRGRSSKSRSSFRRKDQTAVNGNTWRIFSSTIGSPVADPAIGFAIHRRITENDSLKREQHLHIIDKYLGDLYMRICDVPKGTRVLSLALTRKTRLSRRAVCRSVGNYYQGGQGDLAEMERMFRKLTEVDPHGYRGFHGLGYALYMKAIVEPDAEKRTALISEASAQSGAAIRPLL